MKLIDVYDAPEAEDILWQLLSERPPEANISHKKMPTAAEHRAYIASRPYLDWRLIDAGEYVGAVYLGRWRELGVAVLRRHQGNGYARNALVMMMERHGSGRFLANIAPRNDRSRDLFAGMGFRQIQHTYELWVP